MTRTSPRRRCRSRPRTGDPRTFVLAQPIVLGEQERVDRRGQENACHWHVAEVNAQSSLSAPDPSRETRGSRRRWRTRSQGQGGRSRSTPQGTHTPSDGANTIAGRATSQTNATRNCRYHCPPSQASHRLDGEAMPLPHRDVISRHARSPPFLQYRPERVAAPFVAVLDRTGPCTCSRRRLGSTRLPGDGIAPTPRSVSR